MLPLQPQRSQSTSAVGVRIVAPVQTCVGASKATLANGTCPKATFANAKLAQARCGKAKLAQAKFDTATFAMSKCAKA